MQTHLQFCWLCFILCGCSADCQNVGVITYFLVSLFNERSPRLFQEVKIVKRLEKQKTRRIKLFVQFRFLSCSYGKPQSDGLVFGDTWLDGAKGNFHLTLDFLPGRQSLTVEQEWDRKTFRLSRAGWWHENKPCLIYFQWSNPSKKWCIRVECQCLSTAVSKPAAVAFLEAAICWIRLPGGRRCELDHEWM